MPGKPNPDNTDKMLNLPPWNKSFLTHNSIPVAIISLADATDRREKLLYSGFPISWIENYWPATDMRKVTQADLNTIDGYIKMVGVYGREILPGEIGCFFSHRALIKWYSEHSSADLLVVFEDDAVPTEDFKRRLLGLISFLNGPIFLGKSFICHLGSLPSQWKSSFSRRIFSSDLDKYDMKIYQHIDKRNSIWRAHSYIISKEAAIRYTKHDNSTFFVADDWQRITRKFGIDLLFIVPRLFFQDDSFESSIDLNSTRGFPKKLKQPLFIRDAVNFFWHRLRLFFVSCMRSLPGKHSLD